MRLRQRPPRALGEGWVQPRRSGRWTTVGNLDSPSRAVVDPAGLLTVVGARWSVDWWVGAEDRWHLPCREVAVRQSLVGNSPVVETRLRVPSGDAVHRVHAARDASGAEAVVIDIENQSKVPFAVAVAVRPHDQLDIGRIDEVVLDGTAVTVDGDPALLLPRSPGRMALADGATDSATIVLAGEAARVRSARARCADGLASAALLFPLAHTASLRIVVPLGRSAPDRWALPSGAQVASGWGTQTERGVRIELPDRRLRDAFLASSRHLLLGQGTPEVAAALDLLGFPDEAHRSLTAEPAALARTDRPGAALRAVVLHHQLTRDDDFARGVVGLVAGLVAALGRSHDAEDRDLGARCLPAAAALLEVAGEDRAAADVRRSAATLPAPRDADGAGQLVALLSSAGGTWTWPGSAVGHDPVANAALVTLVRSLFVTESDDGLALSPSVPDPWLGQGWELHDAPTAHGRLSYAVRWHGDRPALLWHVDPHPGAGPVRLTIPGLDSMWSTTELKGEALLSSVALPERAPRVSLSMPVAIEPHPGRPT